MSATLRKSAINLIIIAVIGALTALSQNASAVSEYGPMIGAVAALALAYLHKLSPAPAPALSMSGPAPTRPRCPDCPSPTGCAIVCKLPDGRAID